MKTPRYTDTHRYPHGYKKSGHTDIAATYRRIRAELKAKTEADAINEAEAKAKLRTLKRGNA